MEEPQKRTIKSFRVEYPIEKVYCECGERADVGEPENKCWACYNKNKEKAEPIEVWKQIFAMKRKK